jgi:hypothetical protein
MKSRRLLEITAAASALAVVVVGGLLIHSPRLQAQNQGNDDESKIKQGFDIAPVKLNIAGKDRALVGLGSYIVNAVGDCNGCHSAGPPTEFAPGGNPYFLPGAVPPLFGGTKQINTATYLGGGRDFGQLGNPATGAHIISRNLTPNKTGMAVGGATFSEFLNLIRTGTDMDFIHPYTCPAGSSITCVPFPFDPTKLLVMRWPFFKDMTDHDRLAIYTYLSSVPCIAGPNLSPANPMYPVVYPVLHNDCGP